MPIRARSATAPDRRRWRRPSFYVRTLLVLVPSLVLFLLVVDRCDVRTPDLHVDASDRVGRLLEQASQVEHGDIGLVVAAGDHVSCGATVFGIDPASAATLDDVSEIYGNYLCAVGAPGVPWARASRVRGAVVAHLGDQPRLEIATPGAGYEQRVRAIMPDQYAAASLANLVDPYVADSVRLRYEAALAQDPLR